MKLYDKNAVAKFLDMTPKNVERLTQKGILQTKQGNLYALAETNRAYIKYLRDRNPESQEAVDLNEERAKGKSVGRDGGTLWNGAADPDGM